MHHGRGSDSAVYPVDEDAGADGVRYRPELGLLIRFSSCGRQLPRKSGREPLPDLWRHCVRLNFRKLIIFVGEPPVGKSASQKGLKRV